VSEPSKKQLQDEAEDLGVDTAGLTKPQLEDAIEAKQPPATPELGPIIPASGEPEPFESVGATTGVQPITPDDIPEAGR
jgi:hypothetical protein